VIAVVRDCLLDVRHEIQKLGFQRQRVIENYRTIEDRVCDGFAYQLEARDGG
jgi:hypothetical protein